MVLLVKEDITITQKHKQLDFTTKKQRKKLMEDKYGYKVSYQELGKRKIKLYLVTNTLDGAIWNVRWYQTTPQFDRKDNHLIDKPFWLDRKSVV